MNPQTETNTEGETEMKMIMTPEVCADSTLTSSTGNNMFDVRKDKNIVRLTESELKAVTRGDLIYEAAARVMINKGLWVLVPEVV